MNQHIDNRLIRVFISSTFKDMQPERDYLMSQVFPRLRMTAAEREVTLIELDLRWGITEAESQGGKVVQICLNEIENSHPFFIGLMGDRYGWCPPLEILHQDTALSERYPWIESDLRLGKSITEIEMQYGALRRKGNDLNAYFFIKKDGEGIELKQKEFKNEVRSNTRYAHYEYSTSVELGQYVEEAFNMLLDRLYPKKELSDLERERMSHRSFLRSLCDVYIGNEDDIHVLNGFMENDSQYLVISGQSGIGKSALIANWLTGHDYNQRFNVIYHYVGYSGEESRYSNILTHLINEIEDIYDIAKETEELDNGVRKESAQILQQLLAKISDRKPLLIILDGIDQLDEDYRENTKYLNWLPSFPYGSKIIFTTTDEDETMDSFRRKEYPIYCIQPLDFDQRLKLIDNYLSRFGKSLVIDQVKRIAMDRKMQNTRLLRVLLNELICFGIHEKLEERIEYYLEAEDVKEFYQRVLQRAEDTFGRDIVCDALSLICVSYEGMSEAELRAITGVSQLTWSSFYCSFVSHFTLKKGLLNFSHSLLKEAVKNRYLNQEKEDECRQRIIDFFKIKDNKRRDHAIFKYERMNDVNTRIWSELAHQYLDAKLDGELHSLVLRLDVFLYLHNRCRERLRIIWKYLRSQKFPSYSLADYLSSEYVKDVSSPYYYLDIGWFAQYYFNDIQTVEAAYKKEIEYLRTSEYRDSISYKSALAQTLHNLGILHKQCQNYECAEQEYQEAFCLYQYLNTRYPEVMDHQEGMVRTLHNMGSLHRVMGKYSTAENELQEALVLRRNLVSKDFKAYLGGLALTLNTLGLLHSALDKFELAESEYQEALEIRQRLSLSNPETYHPDVAETLYCLGMLYKKSCEYSKAEDITKKSLGIYSNLALMDPETYNTKIADALWQLGAVSYRMKDYKQSESYYLKAINILRNRKTGKSAGIDQDIASLIYCLGLSYEKSGNISLAKEKFLELVEIRKRSAYIKSDKYDETFADALNKLGNISNSQGNYKQAQVYYKDALVIRRRLASNGIPSSIVDVAYTLHNFGSSYLNLQEYADAEILYKEAIKIRRKLCSEYPGGHEGNLALSSQCLGFLYVKTGDLVAAEKCFQEAETLYRQLDKSHSSEYEEDFAMLLCNLGCVYMALCKYQVAIDVWKESIQIYKKIQSGTHGKYDSTIENLEKSIKLANG